MVRLLLRDPLYRLGFLWFRAGHPLRQRIELRLVNLHSFTVGSCGTTLFFFSFLIDGAAGRFSGIVPPIFWMVFRTSMPTSRCVLIALVSPFIPLVLSLSSACVTRNSLAASSVGPIQSRRSSFSWIPFLALIALTPKPAYKPFVAFVVENAEHLVADPGIFRRSA